MSNLLTIPFKKTYTVDIKEAARHYLYEFGGGHPDEFIEDTKLWQNLRENGVGGVVHNDRINSSLMSIGLEMPYAPVFQDKAVPISLKSLVFERCGVLFNLASLYSQLATSEDRSTTEGIKRASANYQHAAGVLSFLRISVAPKLILPSDEEQIPRDIAESFLSALEQLMLAQAQECSWQMAKLNQYKNGLIAKVSSLYQATTHAIRGATPPITDIFPANWLPHIESKVHHFSAVSKYRKSMDEIEASRYLVSHSGSLVPDGDYNLTFRYGVEIARLLEAHEEAKKAYEIARRGRIAPSVLQDVQSLLEIVQKDLHRAERDNDLIYHQDVPAPSALVPIAQTNLVSSVVPIGLSNPASFIEGGRVIFGDLVGWGANEAINIYNDRRRNLIKEKILDTSNELQDTADETLRRLNLPAALEALERPIGLPPSLLRKAEEVRLEDGPKKVELSLEDVQRLAQQDQAILDEAMDILDNEASEDEAARKLTTLDRLPSYQANIDLVAKEKRYRSILVEAAASDETVRQKWDEWEQSIVELTWSEEDLESSIPSSTITSSTATTPQGRETQSHARALRVQIESLDDVHRAREQLVRRARALEAADDIRERVMRVAGGFARLTEVTPAMFEDLSDEELAKYDKFLVEMNEIGQRQGAVLAEIQRRNEPFLQSRKDDPIVKEREYALQSLDLAYHKYREITRNLEEGLKFKEACRNWSRARNQQIHSLRRSLQNMSLDSNLGKLPASPMPKEAAEAYPGSDHTAQPRAPSGGELDANRQSDLPSSTSQLHHERTRSTSGPDDLRGILQQERQQRFEKETATPTIASKHRGQSTRIDLPPLGSSEWEFEDIKLPPPPPTPKRRH
ncbi:hypothetical protein H0H93_010540 [Arthromyces matolae]|nr:hypothetical protein H0H93_010540 [Arthromyces matolae]